MTTKTEASTTKIRRVALNMLARRDHSRQELSQKLKAKGCGGEDIKTVLDALVQEGLINEPRFAENYIYWRRGKGFGPARIAMELQTRGIASETIAQHLQIADNAWFTEARKVWQKHFRGKLPHDNQSRARQMRFLQYRGFTREQIESVLDTDFD